MVRATLALAPRMRVVAAQAIADQHPPEIIAQDAPDHLLTAELIAEVRFAPLR
jgi:hypothetical protein